MQRRLYEAESEMERVQLSVSELQYDLADMTERASRAVADPVATATLETKLALSVDEGDTDDEIGKEGHFRFSFNPICCIFDSHYLRPCIIR